MVKKVVTTLLIAGSLFGFNAVEGGTAPTPPATGGNSSQTNAPAPAGNYATTYPTIKGKVVKAYVRPGFGPAGNQWLFMDVETSNGVVSVGIAPTFVISNLPVREGDIVEVRGFTPPFWGSNTLRAWDIYDVTQKRDYPIAGPGIGGRGCWRWHRGPWWRYR